MKHLSLFLVLTCCTYTGHSAGDDSQLAQIYNFLRINDNLISSGQVTAEQTQLLKPAGVKLVVNLATPDKANDYADEAYLVTQQGISYLQIPVAWESPTFNDLDLFFTVMDASQDHTVLVHCMANYRAAVFIYLYRTIRGHSEEATARAALEQIWPAEAWTQYPQWSAFLESAKKRPHSP
ncbi:MAG: phosphatase [Gammaproteobacteria bacterium]|jgi:protein tyrosine phosphatase (PTP) superfamily phosphohydrolase (DUF442 family)|nr:phosphatase [Gammaproteobacteria bacterium]MBT5204761.1 phosphatase [Gammaproteobacteria bacterium]MBT5601315.1 phosphatase [Gammaproteobacteria bacterium]MBT6244990.1 phosphatase [Gammaproteobacteria bacterium]